MKTIRVIFTKSKKESWKAREFTFNTSLPVEVGDLIKSDKYTTFVQVTAIEDDYFTHIRLSDGVLLHEAEEGNVVELVSLTNENSIITDGIEQKEYKGF